MSAFLRLSVALLSLLAPSGEAADRLPFAPGRVAEVDGSLLLLPSGWDEWREAELNSALAPGDWLRTGRDATASLELSHSLMARMGPDSELRIDRRDGVLVLELLDGSLAVCSGERGEALSVVTVHGASWLRPDGFYRLDATARRTRVVVHSGLAEVQREDRVRSVRAGRLGELASGGAKPSVRSSAGQVWDSFDRDSQEACERVLGVQSSLELVGARDLSRHGEWIVIGGRDHWRPYEVGPDWRPYGDGCFRWHPSWGWYFVPRHSWGWVTHHHGWWSWVDGWGWVWLPDDAWHPHRVRFRVVDDHVYWCPRDRGREDHRHRSPEGHRNADHEHEQEQRDPLPAHGWSRAPILDFGKGPIVQVRPSIGQGGLPRLSVPSPSPSPTPVPAPAPLELDRPPLPPRAVEPATGARRPFVARTPRPSAPALITDPLGGVEMSPPELPGRELPGRPQASEPATAPRPVLRQPTRPVLPPPRLSPRPWERERVPPPESRPVPVAPPTARPQREPERVLSPQPQPARPVVRPPERRPEAAKPVVRQPERRLEPPKPVVRQPERRPEPPKPVVRPPVRRRPAPPPAPAPAPKVEEKESGEKDDGKRRRR